MKFNPSPIEAINEYVQKGISAHLGWVAPNGTYYTHNQENDTLIQWHYYIQKYIMETFYPDIPFDFVASTKFLFSEGWIRTDIVIVLPSYDQVKEYHPTKQQIDTLYDIYRYKEFDYDETRESIRKLLVACGLKFLRRGDE